MTTTSDRPTTVPDPAPDRVGAPDPSGPPRPASPTDPPEPTQPPDPTDPPDPTGPPGAADEVPVLRLSRARDLLAYLPHRLGFRPEESLVAAGVDRDRRLGLVARVDLADLAGPSGHLLAEQLVNRLVEADARSVVVGLHTAVDPREPDGHGGLRPVPGTAVLVAGDRFAHAWNARGADGRLEEWVVTAGRYLDLDCSVPACCPLGGRPLDDGSADTVDRRLTAAGSVVAGRRRDLGRIDLAPAPARRSADSARLRWADRLRRARRACATSVRPVGRPVDGPVGPAPGRTDEARADGSVPDAAVLDAAVLDAAVPDASGLDAPVPGASAAGDAFASGDAARAVRVERAERDRDVGQDCPVRRWRRDSLDLWSSALAAATAGPADGSGPLRREGPDGAPLSPPDPDPAPRVSAAQASAARLAGPVGPVPPAPSAPRAGSRGAAPGDPAPDDPAPDDPAPDDPAPDETAPHPPAPRGPMTRTIAPRALGRLESALTDRLVRDAILVSVLVPGSGLPTRMLDASGHDAGRCAAGACPADRPGAGGRGAGGREASGGGASGPEASGGDGPAPDGEHGNDGSVSGEDGRPPLAGALSTIFDPDRRRRPDPVRTEAAVRVLQQVVAHGRVGHQAPALTLLALIAWWVGDGPRASVLGERALRDDPEHALARLVNRLVDLGVPPGWLRPRP